MKVSIDLTPDQVDRPRFEAERLGLSPEDLARAAVVEVLDRPSDDFAAAAERVLKKNEELTADLQRRILQGTAGAMGLRDQALESAIAQPQATFSGVDLYPTLAEKAAALCFALIQDMRRWRRSSS